ncbi:hypothetical protein CCM_09030 [Cordyceps militaris CM01]|uniref:Uncharacterized protein n=1 Tax=Cordyceps militaris (strain CM01) TaxID=983644 RepID=G3JSY7_CORMM|nr:uncharacterized protein CCM_09030 [Cordyceps militaris CM01]EGX88983.1 hypothetical protein CCM_09030 [Cordyceps militaris CM01]
MATVLAGASFGAAMIAAGFSNPAVVIAQLRFSNWHMMQAFLAATASSIDRAGWAKLTPRASAPLGLLPTTYDGNLLGGALLGAGMALSGSCPGTLFAQMAAGVHTGFYALAGALAGGVLWTGVLSPVVARRRKAPVTVTVNEYLGVSKPAAMLLYELVFSGVLVATARYAPARFPGTSLPGALGGLLISLSQLLSIATRGSMIGISGSHDCKTLRLAAALLGRHLNLNLHLVLHERRLDHGRRRTHRAEIPLQHRPRRGKVGAVRQDVAHAHDVGHAGAGVGERLVNVGEGLLGLRRDVGGDLARGVVVPGISI